MWIEVISKEQFDVNWWVHIISVTGSLPPLLGCQSVLAILRVKSMTYSENASTSKERDLEYVQLSERLWVPFSKPWPWVLQSSEDLSMCTQMSEWSLL